MEVKDLKGGVDISHESPTSQSEKPGRPLQRGSWGSLREADFCRSAISKAQLEEELDM
jgi:hypothetical protein